MTSVANVDRRRAAPALATFNAASPGSRSWFRATRRRVVWWSGIVVRHALVVLSSNGGTKQPQRKSAGYGSGIGFDFQEKSHFAVPGYPIRGMRLAAESTPPRKFNDDTAALNNAMRHTYASRLAMRGVPLAVIAIQLGHRDTRMVEKHYGHLSPGYVAETVRAAFGTLGIGSIRAKFSVRGTSAGSPRPEIADDGSWTLNGSWTQFPDGKLIFSATWQASSTNRPFRGHASARASFSAARHAAFAATVNFRTDATGSPIRSPCRSPSRPIAMENRAPTPLLHASTEADFVNGLLKAE